MSSPHQRAQGAGAFQDRARCGARAPRGSGHAAKLSARTGMIEAESGLQNFVVDASAPLVDCGCRASTGTYYGSRIIGSTSVASKLYPNAKRAPHKVIKRAEVSEMRHLLQKKFGWQMPGEGNRSSMPSLGFRFTRGCLKFFSASSVNWPLSLDFLRHLFHWPSGISNLSCSLCPSDEHIFPQYLTERPI